MSAGPNAGLIAQPGPAPGRLAPDERFTPPPGEESEPIRTLIDRAAAALRSGPSTGSVLADAAYLPAHPYPRFRRLIRQSATAATLTLVSAHEPGEPLTVTATVVDRQGRPVRDALVYVYHTSSRGWYAAQAAHVAANEGDRRHARLFGYLRTDAAGRFELHTIRPAGYPDSNLPAHIHVEIEPKGLAAVTLVTEILFDDDPRLTAAARQRSEQEGFVTARVQRDPRRGQRVSVQLTTR